MGATIFVVDDDAAQLNITEAMLAQRCQYRTISALGGKAAIERFLLRQQPKPDLLLLDLVMPEVNGVEVVRAIRRCDPYIPIIVLAPADQNSLVMEAIQAGANDCMRKPVSIQFLKVTIDKLLQREAMRQELCRLSRYGRADFRYEDIVGDSAPVQAMLQQAKELAPQNMPICIEGEAGVGKELLARVMHNDGAHAKGQFVALSCKAEHAFFTAMMQGAKAIEEAELPFRFSKSEGGTLFLRHVERLSLEQQEALADFLLGARASCDPQWLHVRFMASTLEPVARLYRQGRLHEKLYFYFSACTIAVPALRERQEDIPHICRHYLRRFTATQPYMINGLTPQAKTFMKKQLWPDNVNEIIGLMQRASYQTQNALLEEYELMALLDMPYTPPSMGASQQAGAVPAGGKGQFCLLNMGGEVKPIEQLEAEVIRFAIEHYGGKMTEVAKKLGIGRSTLYRKMQDYKLRHVA